MKWKTWISALLVFVGVCLLADWAMTRWLILGTPFTDAGRIHHLLLEHDGEIPIFGTSKAHGQYCPADMGLNAYNYGLDNASFELTYVLLQIELAKPKTTPVIVELQFSDTGQLGEQSTLIPFASDDRFRRLLNKFHAMSWRYHLPGVRYFGYYDIYFNNFDKEVMHRTTVNRGFTELVNEPPFDPAKLDQAVQARLRARTGYFPNPDQDRRLLELITTHTNRLFFLVLAPYHPSYFAHFENAAQFKAFETKLAAHPNVALIDRSREALPDEDFMDTIHLRRAGSAQFSREMGEQIRRILRERGQPSS